MTIDGWRYTHNPDGTITATRVHQEGPLPNGLVKRMIPEEQAKLRPPHPMLLLNAQSCSQEELEEMWNAMYGEDRPCKVTSIPIKKKS